MSDETRIRVNFSAGEVEIAGTADRVREWWKLLDEDIAEFRRRFAGGGNTSPLPIVTAANAIPERAARSNHLIIPETFGEFIQQFPSTVTDIERALVAGFFAQSRDENSSFTTGAVNELLIQQGVRLANPSASIRRNVDARRAILLGSGQFRVSPVGVEHLGRLQEQQS